MADDKYIVLRAESPMVPVAAAVGPPAGVPRAAMSSFGAGPQTLAIEEAELTAAERNDLRRDPRTRAIALPMPMKLIEPLVVADAQPSANGVTWGVDAVGAADSAFDGTGITVAVLDTGIDPNHEAFQGVNLVQRNFTQGAEDDEHGHGTHCAGTIFGQNVDSTRIGVAPGVSRALIGKVLGAGGGSSATIAQAIQWAVNEGANVVSMSLGIDFPGFVDAMVAQGLDVNPATSIALEQYRANINLFSQLAGLVQAQGAFGAGTVIVSASGNESERPTYEIAVAPPAAGNGIVSVGALQEGAGGMSVASFSNNQVNVSAPGVGIVSARAGGGLVSMNGTSMATPHSAGIAALWAQHQLDTAGRIDAETLVAQLIGSGTRDGLDPSAEAEDVGTGIVQAP